MDEPVTSKKGQEEYVLEEVLNQNVKTSDHFVYKILIPNAIFFVILHLCAVYGIYSFIFRAKILTVLWGIFLSFLSGEAITLGAHRYYSHKSYQATTSLKIILLIFQTVSGQNSMFTWARDHRTHHKYSDTDADPHNASRGFFFSHFGWLIMKKHPLVIEKRKGVDISDLMQDKLLMFQHRHFVPLYLLLGFTIPTLLPIYGWNENFWTSFFVAYCFRYVVVLHLTWSVNSVAHMFGTKPYDRRIASSQSKFLSMLTGGDGWHNYHHAFPWDYRSSEFGLPGGLNTRILDLLARHGYVYNRKTASVKVVYGHLKRHGDGTHHTMSEMLGDNEKLAKILEPIQ